MDVLRSSPILDLSSNRTMHNPKVLRMLHPKLKMRTLKFIFLFIILFVGIADKVYSQVYLDTIVYSGHFKMGDKYFSFHRIKEVAENLTNRMILNDDHFTAEKETLEIYNDRMEKVYSCQTSDLIADCNSATITKSKCIITDSTIEISKYYFWTGLCVNCNIGIIYETYKLNTKGTFEMIRKLDKSFIVKKGKLRFTEKELRAFERAISSYGLLKKHEKSKLVNLLK